MASESPTPRAGNQKVGRSDRHAGRATAALSAERAGGAFIPPPSNASALQRALQEGSAAMVAVEAQQRYRATTAGKQKRNGQSQRTGSTSKAGKPPSRGS